MNIQNLSVMAEGCKMFIPTSMQIKIKKIRHTDKKMTNDLKHPQAKINLQKQQMSRFLFDKSAKPQTATVTA